MKVTVIGLGRLGAPIAATLAAKGFEVHGVDRDARVIDAITRGIAPVHEPQLTEMLAMAAGRLQAGDDIAAAVSATDMSVIVVPTPSEPDGGFSLRQVLPVCEAIAAGLSRRRGYHLVCLTSTVMPGMTGGVVQEVLERVSGRRCGVDFGLCYSPEFIALGSVIRDFLHPDLLLIGESDRQAGDMLERLYRDVCERAAPVARMSFAEAEIAKLAINAYVTTKITFANLLARICERTSGADVDVVTRAIGLDSRIGGKYLTGAVSYGGPCFPRDNLAMSALARGLGVPADVPQAVDRFNRGLVTTLADDVCARTTGTVGILGLAYKVGTDVTEESVGALLAAALVQRGHVVHAYDPAVSGTPAAVPHGVTLATSARACVRSADLVVVTTPWPGYADPDVIALDDWARHAAPRIVFDCWRVLPTLRAVDGIVYVGLGLGPAAA